MELMLCQRVEFKQRLELRQSLAQRLIGSKSITGIAECPTCRRGFDPDEQDAWSHDPDDFHVTCPYCRSRFIATIAVEPMIDRAPTRSGVPRMPRTRWYDYLCPTQTLAALRRIWLERESRRFPGLSWLYRNAPAVLYSAVLHFGSLDGAKRRLMAV